MANTVLQEVELLLGVEQKADEAPAAYARRLAVKANDVTDDNWQTLSEKAQQWVNDALDAIQHKKEVPLPDGLEAPEALAETEAEAPKPNGAKVAPEKPEAKGKPAKKKAAPAKKATPAKGKAKAAKGGSGKTGRPGPRGRFGLESKIKLLKKENPFRPESKCANWWKLLKDGSTVEEAIAGGVPRHHIRWEQTLGYVKIG